MRFSIKNNGSKLFYGKIIYYRENVHVFVWPIYHPNLLWKIVRINRASQKKALHGTTHLMIIQ